MQKQYPKNTYHQPYHFFGNLWLELPEDHLSPEELKRLKALEPLFRHLEGQQRKSTHNINETFSTFTTRETEVWRKLGVERPQEMLLHLSGDINAPIACHLYNPTFYAKDPYSRETDNNTIPTIQQVNQAGFTSQNCFMFDHICRRDRTEDVLLFYGDEIRSIHEDFMLSLRKIMTAKVEICWGRHVRERMKKLVNLVSLKLWGSYQNVELFLEMEDSELVRFIVFVAHPQFFFYHGSGTERGIQFRKTMGRKQDIYLAVAGKLGGILTEPSFYEKIHRPALYGQFRKENRELVSRLEAEADTQLRKAFPLKYQEIELAASQYIEDDNKRKAQDSISQTLLSELIRSDTKAEELQRAQKLQSIAQTLLETAGQVLTEGTYIRSLSQLQLLSEIPSDWDEVLEWDEIPNPLITWVQAQNGLKIDQKPISSKEELITACHLLAPTNDSYCDQTLMQTLIRTATWYIARVRKQRHKSVQDLIIPGAVPYAIMPRKCAKCGERVLDDAFACYAKEDPRKYVIWYRHGGCGRPGCRTGAPGTQFVHLIPANSHQAYKLASRQKLRAPRITPWEEYLLRCSEEELKDMLQEVHITCEKCRVETMLDTHPRWTAEAPARYVIRRMKCKTCKKSYMPFVPSASHIRTITQPGLSKKWKDLNKGGVKPTRFPRRPDILWSRMSYISKRKQLERERAKELARKENRLPPPEPRRRNFDSKRRLKYGL